MTHFGPDPSEALPIGEEALSPDETGRLANFMFELTQSIDELNAAAELTTEEYDSIRRLKDTQHDEPMDEIFELAKDIILHPRRESD
jgi:hypothetical protein